MTKPLTAMILQGGGALGAYQAGVFEQLAARDVVPDWVIGTSIGAINGAIIAGNVPEDRLPKLRSFWQGLAPARAWLPAWVPDAWSHMFNPFAPLLADSARDGNTFNAVISGIGGFFKPRFGAGFNLSAPVAIADAGFYDTSPLRDTLRAHVNFDYLNDGPVRLTVCAVDVETAEFKVFDTRDPGRLGPEHIMASGALPPAFPPVVIENRAYWDGGIYSNTPLEVLLNEVRTADAVAFMVDLWDSTETLPKTMADVMGRVKSIQYAGRATEQLATQARIEDLQRTIRALAALIPDASMEDGMIATLAAEGCGGTVNVVRLVMKAFDGDNQFKDVDFSAATVAARWAAGQADAARALTHEAWLAPVPPHAGLIIHELEQI